MRICSKCKIEKPKSEFYKNKHNKDGLRVWCITCAKKDVKRYDDTPNGKETRKNKLKNYLQTPGGKKVHRNNRLQYNYGITIEQYDQMLQSQGGVCKICGTATPGGMGRFVVDHNHKTGKVRGLLCNRCNTKLGGVEDKEFLQRALEYLSLEMR